MKSLFLIGSIWVFAAITQAVLANTDEYVESQNARQRTLLRSCELQGIEECAINYGLNMSVFEVFQKMSTEPFWFMEVCDNPSFIECISDCQQQFKASKYGYMLNACNARFMMAEKRYCWDENFPQQARHCYLYHYSYERLEALYPIPLRVYDLNTVARDCFRSDNQDCRYSKSVILKEFMPNYYGIFYYPHGYEVRSNYL